MLFIGGLEIIILSILGFITSCFIAYKLGFKAGKNQSAKG